MNVIASQSSVVEPELTEASAARDAIPELLPALVRLDQLLESAVRHVREARGWASGEGPGLYICADDAERQLTRVPLEGALPGFGSEVAFEPRGGLAWIKQAYGLSRFETDALLVALAPELDLRYERLYAYLQDDLTRSRPTVDLVLSLLCGSYRERLARRVAFTAAGSLTRHGLIHVYPDPHRAEPALIAQLVRPDELVVRALLGEPGLDPRLQPIASEVQPSGSEPGPDETLLAGIVEVTRRTPANRPAFAFYGPDSAGRAAAARCLAAALGTTLLSVDVRYATEAAPDDLIPLISLAQRDADLRRRVLCLDGIDALSGPAHASTRRELATVLAARRVPLVLSGGEEANIPGLARVVPVEFPAPGYAVRRLQWQAALSAARATVAEKDLDALAGQPGVGTAEIAAIVADACRHASWRKVIGSGSGRPSVDDLVAASRARTGTRLVGLSTRIEPRHGWNDIVLPADQHAQLREICDRARLRPLVHDEWGFGRKLTLGKGVDALFTGPPGTGKTLAAEVVARELRLDLYKIDLSQVVSKYIGETEKNLGRVFAEAEAIAAVLFFDEADALFGKRSEVKDAHDRYANIEVGYLLQKMEEYDGIVVLATNLGRNLDEAFTRRLHAVVEFPFPDQEQRQLIWALCFPREAPLDPEVNLAMLARTLELPGGSIRNVALAAAFQAAADGQSIRLCHLELAARRELAKLGRVWNEDGWRRAA